MSLASTTIAARATPAGRGGIAVIRISGPQAIEIASSVFVPKTDKSLSQMAGYTAAFGQFVEQQIPFDEGIALVFHAPASFTGENVVELSCHGGLYLSERLLAAIYAAGAAPAAPGEFTKRAFLNGKLDLSAAESVLELIDASSESSLKAAFEDKNGRLFTTVSTLKEKITGIIAEISAWIDYPDQDIPPPQGLEQTLIQLEKAFDKLLSGYENGRIMREGINTAIIGRPNTGKSALMNRLSGTERSIVTEQAGTTRDIIEETVRLGNFVLRLADTAGIHHTLDTVESIGVQRALDKVQQSQLLLAVFDGSRPLQDEDKQVITACHDKTAIALVNKSDLPLIFDLTLLHQSFKQVILVSAKTGQGIGDLETAISKTFSITDIDQATPFNTRQKDCALRAQSSIKEALQAIQSGLTPDAVQLSLEDAASALMELTGERVTDQILDQIFSRFCVGK